MANEDFNESQLSQMLQKKVELGEIDQDAANKALNKFRMQQLPEGNIGSALWEPTKAIGASLLGAVKAGGAGLFQLAKGDGLGEAVEEIDRIQGETAEFATPKTQAGTKALENVSDLIQMGVDVAQFSISGLAGILELVKGQGLDQAAQTIKDVQTKGVAQTAGDRVLEETGSPLMATAAYMGPELVASIFPLLGKVGKIDKFNKAVVASLKDGQSNPQLARGINDFQLRIEGPEGGNLLPQLEQLIQDATPRIQNQLVHVAEDIQMGVDSKGISTQLGKIANDAARTASDSNIVGYVQTGANGIKKDKLAIDAINQGFDQGIVAMIKAATPRDRTKMLAMLDIMDRGKRDARYKADNRVTDVAGNTLVERVKFITDVNKKSGAELEQVVKDLKFIDEPLDFSSPVNNFITRLDDMDIRLDANNNPDFMGSTIQGIVPAEKIIKDVINRMKADKPATSYDAHKLKRFIDEKVTYGKEGEGLTGQTVRVLKDLRRELDAELDTKYPEYNRVNTTYSETIGALDDLQSAVGGKMDMLSSSGDSAVGTVIRRTMGNTANRGRLVDSIDQLESISRKYGGEFADDAFVQSIFANELETVFKIAPRTAIQNTIAVGAKQGIRMATGNQTVLGLLIEAGAAVANKAKGVTDDNAAKSIRKLLERN